MPRKSKGDAEAGAAEPKRRSRTGCWPCKARKVKCDEAKPSCANCVKNGETCDYSIRLNWGGRARRDADGTLHSSGNGNSGGGGSFFTFVGGGADGGDPVEMLPSGRPRSRGSRISTVNHISDVDKGQSKGHEMHPHLFSAQHLATIPRGQHKQNAVKGDYVASSAASSPDEPTQKPSPDFQPGTYQDGSTTLPPVSAYLPPIAPDDFSWSSQHRAKRVRLSNPLGMQAPANGVQQLQSPSQGMHSPGSQHYPSPSTGGAGSPLISELFSPTTQAFLAGLDSGSPASGFRATHTSSPYMSQFRGQPETQFSPPQSTSNLTVQQDPSALRRMSVKSLLVDTTEDDDPDHKSIGIMRSIDDARPRARTSDHPTSQSEYRTYGYDHGYPDLDLPHNDDDMAIAANSAPGIQHTSVADSDSSTNGADDSASANRVTAFEAGGYYARPVPVRIPVSLEPLPEELLQNRMNLLYFHHFLNHTSRILVPRDCDQNPFRMVLPVFAVKNRHLLHLLLAYSATHRANLLGHSEPATRIAGWMDDVISALRVALNTSAKRSTAAHSNSPDDPDLTKNSFFPNPDAPAASDPTEANNLHPLATAIMLASFTIITPNSTPELIQIPWQSHLGIARQIILQKGGLGQWAYQTPRADRPGHARENSHTESQTSPSHGSHAGMPLVTPPIQRVRNKAIFFLSRWFAYLDVLGSLSNRHSRPLTEAYQEDGGGMWLVNRDRDEDEIWQIDCFFGFSGKCIALLAQVADLMAAVDGERLLEAREDGNGQMRFQFKGVSGPSNPPDALVEDEMDSLDWDKLGGLVRRNSQGRHVVVVVRPGWMPNAATHDKARFLVHRLEESLDVIHRHARQVCIPTTDLQGGPAEIMDGHAPVETRPASGLLSATTSCCSEDSGPDIYACNTAFHHLGMLLIYRRVLGLPSSHPQVQTQVQAIIAVVRKVRRGSAADTCLLFPMFAAGCELSDADASTRKSLLDRLREVEGWGLVKVVRAVKIMQEVWRTGQPWECLVDGEFFG